MHISDCFYLGKIIKPFGYSGECIIGLDVDEPGNYQKMESVFVRIHDKLVPFFFERLTRKSQSHQFIVRFQGIDTAEKIEPLFGKELYLPLSMLPELRGNQFYYHEVEGFLVIDEKHGPVGTLVQVIDLPGNPLLEVLSGQKEVLVPLREEFILEVDRVNKTILISAPDGLIDMYLHGVSDL